MLVALENVGCKQRVASPMYTYLVQSSDGWSITECPKEKQRRVIWFLWSEGVETGETLSLSNGGNCVSQRTVCGCVERCK